MEDVAMNNAEQESVKQLITNELLTQRMEAMKNECANQAEEMIEMALLEEISLAKLRRHFTWEKELRQMGLRLLIPFTPPSPCGACQKIASYIDRVHYVPCCNTICYAKILINKVTRERAMVDPPSRRGLNNDHRRVKRIVNHFNALREE